MDTIIKEVYGLTVLYRHINALTGTILSHFSIPKMTLKTIAKVNKLDAGTPSLLLLCVYTQCNISIYYRTQSAI